MPELNLDGLIGPTHNFGGLAEGNLASMQNRLRRSHPRAAARQGLAKMWLCLQNGIPQGIIPPRERPYLPHLRQLGFRGRDREVLAAARIKVPEQLLICSSASAMWTANAATITASADAADSRVHVTPANLLAQPHRAIEARETARWLRMILPPDQGFLHHEPLRGNDNLADEGAANHMRLCPEEGREGLNIFVFGRDGAGAPAPGFRPRQARGASVENADRHHIPSGRRMFLRQDPEVVRQGVFHNDVIAVSHGDLLVAHAGAYEDPDAFARISKAYGRLTGAAPRIMKIGPEEMTVPDAVASYFFNAQIVCLPGGGRLWLAPQQCREIDSAARALKLLTAPEGPVQRLEFVDLAESMANGGGPACLRLRVPLTLEELEKVNLAFLLDLDKLSALEDWVDRHFRESLTIDDLADPDLLRECRAALDALTGLLGCGPLYEFQK